jgi:UDP-glucuronate 4-epimerase
MRVAVTGGAGFIGHHVCAALVARGDSVVAIDSVDDAYDPSLKGVPPGVELVRGDIHDDAALDRALEGADAVVHLAARAGVRESFADPERYVVQNVGGTAAVIEGMRRAGIRRMVYASSSSVYGVRNDVMREDDACDAPASPYAATKRGGELLARAAVVTHGFEVACARLFTVYGPRQRPGMAVARFVEAVRSGRPIVLYGDAASTRDYTFVTDAADGILRALDRASGWRVVNLAGGRAVTLEGVVLAVAEALGVEPIVERQGAREGDVPATRADLTVAREWLGWEPRVEFAEGVRRYVAGLGSRAAGVLRRRPK